MVSSIQVDEEPEIQDQPLLALFHIIIVIIFNVLFFNMFVGIVIEVYKGEMDKVTQN